MKLQKATRCALFAILELASGQDRQLSANEIAEKYGISRGEMRDQLLARYAKRRPQ